MQTLVHHFLERSTIRFPEKIAVIHDDTRVRYKELNAMANGFANWLKDQGTTNGKRVALLLENSLEYIVSYYGALKIGATVVPLNTGMKPDKIKSLLQELQPVVMVSSARFERLLKASDPGASEIRRIVLCRSKLNWDSANVSIVSWGDAINHSESGNPNHEIEPENIANIIYTSGSTGMPKGAMLSHRNIVSNVLAISESLDLDENDIQMVVLPFFYVMGKSLLNTHMAVGGTVVINNTFAYPATVLKQMVEENVTGFSGVPSTYAYLLHRSPLETYREKLVSLRYCSQAGGHMSRHVKERLRQVLPTGVKIYVMYGATEASARLTCLPPEHFKDRIESIGKPINGVTLKVIGEHGGEVSKGETGEIVASGPNIMPGYWQKDNDTLSVLSDLGYHTGDLGYEDPEGFFYVTGRKDDILKVAGHRINLQEIEDALIETDFFVETSLHGFPDELLGNKLVAIAVPHNEEIEKKQIFSKLAETLPGYKIPKDIFFVKALPKHTSGKTDRTKCIEMIKNIGNVTDSEN